MWVNMFIVKAILGTVFSCKKALPNEFDIHIHVENYVDAVVIVIDVVLVSVRRRNYLFFFLHFYVQLFRTINESNE